VSRTATATLVFTDERHRETWLETHGLVPPKHGAYTGVAERVDYEHRRDQATLVFTVLPDGAPWPTGGRAGDAPTVGFAGGHTATSAAGQAAVAAVAPEDHELPFPGRFHKRRLSTLDFEELVALHKALTALVGQGADGATHTWRTHVGAWALFRNGGVR